MFGRGAGQGQTVFSLAWFHAIVQERRSYIPLGWVKAYEYGDGDLKAGLDIINQGGNSIGSGRFWVWFSATYWADFLSGHFLSN